MKSVLKRDLDKIIEKYTNEGKIDIDSLIIDKYVFKNKAFKNTGIRNNSFDSCIFQNVRFTSVYFDGSHFKNCIFQNCIFESIDFGLCEVKFQDSIFYKTNFEKVEFIDSLLLRTGFVCCNFSNFDLSANKLDDCKFISSNTNSIIHSPETFKNSVILN